MAKPRWPSRPEFTCHRSRWPITRPPRTPRSRLKQPPRPNPARKDHQMPVSADELCRGGMSYPVAIEVARQMNAGVSGGDVTKLMSLGIPGEQAKEIAKQINAGAFDSHKL